MAITLDEFIKTNKPHEIDFVFPDKNDTRRYLDLYYLYHSPEERWNKVQSIIFEYFNDHLRKYRNGSLNRDRLIKKLDFPEVPYIALGYSKEGIYGRGGGHKRATLIKNNIFDNNEIKEIGIEALAELAITIPSVGPDVLSDLVANFAMPYFLNYTTEQIKKFDLSTTEINIERVLNLETLDWEPKPKVRLPHFKDGEPRILVPRHLVKKLPIFSKEAFYQGMLRYDIKHRKEDESKTISTIGKRPKITFKSILAELKNKFGSLKNAVVNIAKGSTDLVSGYIKNPFQFNYLRKYRKKKGGANWDAYKSELSDLKPGKQSAHNYAKLLLKIFTALYDGELFGGELQQRSVDELFYYDIIFANSVFNKPFFNALKNQSIKSGAIIIEAKNYGSTELGNQEFNQAEGYTISGGREFIFLASRKDVTEKDIERAKRHFLTHKIIIFPISDVDIKNLINARKESEENFDAILLSRFREILSA